MPGPSFRCPSVAQTCAKHAQTTPFCPCGGAGSVMESVKRCPSPITQESHQLRQCPPMPRMRKEALTNPSRILISHLSCNLACKTNPPVVVDEHYVSRRRLLP